VNVRVLDDGTVNAAFFLSGDGTAGAAGDPAGEPVFDWAVSQGFKILMMNRKKLSLEDIFVKLTSESPIAASSNGA
jgi:ABC-2 type transport system ATP-binding protein